MVENALDTLALALSLARTGMHRPQAEAIASVAAKAVSDSDLQRPEIFDALYSAGLAPVLAETLATILTKLRLPKAGAVVDTFSPACRIEGAGMSMAQAGILLAFIYEREPARRLSAIFSTAHVVQCLEAAGLPAAASEALTRILSEARQGKTPDTLTVARMLEAAGLTAPEAGAIARCLFLVLTRSDKSNLSDALAAGLPAEGACALRDIFLQAVAARVAIDTLKIAGILRTAGIRQPVVSAFADIGRDVASTSVGAVIGTLSLARKLETAEIPFQYAVVLSGSLYRLRNWDFSSIPHVEVIANMLEAAGFDPDDTCGLAAALKGIATWRPA